MSAIPSIFHPPPSPCLRYHTYQPGPGGVTWSPSSEGCLEADQTQTYSSDEYAPGLADGKLIDTEGCGTLCEHNAPGFTDGCTAAGVSVDTNTGPPRQP